MKILFISDLLSYGGASKLIYDLLPLMKKQGHDCELLILMDKNSKYIDELESEGIRVQIVPENIKGHIGRINYIKKYVVDGRYDIIHAHLFPTIYYCSVVKRLLGKKCPPLIMTEHSTDNKRRHKPFLRPLERFMYSPYNCIISISLKTQENLCNWLRIRDKHKFKVIENGVDVRLFRDADSLEKTDIFPNYASEDVLLLTVGSFTKQKNHKRLIEALNTLPEKYKLILAGEGELQTEIRDYVEQLELSDRVEFLGFRKDIAQIMHTADIIVIPSIWEGFGLIAAEAMACGLPIAASNVPGLAEVVGNAGVKFNPYSIKEIADAIIKISNQEIQQQCDLVAQKKVKLYDINLLLSRYLQIYKSI